MKFETTEAFDRDVERLKPEHRHAFVQVVKTRFIAACDAWAAAVDAGGSFVWPRALRVSRMRGRQGIHEMTWSFAAPDGRATFELVRVDGEWRCRWRRVGGHGVYDEP